MNLIKEQIKELSNIKLGNKDIGIFYTPDSSEPWCVMVGNSCPGAVTIGEDGGEIEVNSNRLEWALENALAAVLKYNIESTAYRKRYLCIKQQ